MTHKYYPNLLTPVKLGNCLLKNRVILMPTGLQALQGGEPGPNEAIVLDAARRAKGGAAVVCITGSLQYDDDAHIYWDMSKKNNQHYIAAAAEAIRFYGAKPSFEVGAGMRAKGEYVEITRGMPWSPNGNLSIQAMIDKATIDDMERLSDVLAEQAKTMKYLGYEMVHVHMAYPAYDIPLGGNFLSPHFNHREDEFGGSAENRCRYPNMIFRKIKDACGSDFLIDFRVSGEEPQFEDGLRAEDWVELSQNLKGNIDVLIAHSPTKEECHPSCFMGEQPYVSAAERIKKGGCQVPVAAMGGLQDPIELEAIIAEGKADFIAITRGAIADPDFLNKAYEGRAEDVRPCIRCNRCHDSACRDNKTYVCSVNPSIGIQHRLVHMVNLNPTPRKVAVVGGGPAGMEAALVAANQGHDVTLFEKNGVLGGQLNFADNVAFKFALKKYKNYLIRQTEKSNVKVLLNTAAEPELLEYAGFDEIIVAIGAKPLVPPIKNVNGDNVVTAVEVFGNESGLGESVVIIGGGQVGCETALHLAQCGKKVTVLEMRSELAPDATVLYRGELTDRLRWNDNITVITCGRCTGIGETVTYTDADCASHELASDKVVIAAGMTPLTEESLKFFGCANRVQMVGDCKKVGTVETAVRSAFGVAMNLG